MSYEWKQTIFKPEDFYGSGQYLIRENSQKLISPYIADTGYLSTIMYKVGYLIDHQGSGAELCLISMSDGLVRSSYATIEPDIHGTKYVHHKFSGTSVNEAELKLCEYLNNEPQPHASTYRMATVEEVIRVVLYQRGNRSI